MAKTYQNDAVCWEEQSSSNMVELRIRNTPVARDENTIRSEAALQSLGREMYYYCMNTTHDADIVGLTPLSQDLVLAAVRL